MLPEYMIYDELERMRREREQELEREQPRLEVPRYTPWAEEELTEESESEEGSERGVIIIQM